MENPYADDSHGQLKRSNRTALQPHKWRSVCTKSWELSRQNCYVVHVHAASMRPNRHWKRCQVRVLPAFDYDGMIQMLKQGLAAYKVATENVPRPGPRPHRVVEATGRPSHVEESCQDHDGYLIFFGSCRAWLSFHQRQQPSAPSTRGSLKTSWKWHWYSSSTQSQHLLAQQWSYKVQSLWWQHINFIQPL